MSFGGYRRKLHKFMIFTFCPTTDEISSVFSVPKTCDEEMARVSTLFRNLRFTRTNGRYRFFDNGKTIQRAVQR